MVPGRPPLLNDDRHKKAVEAYSKGASHPMAADCIGVSLKAINNWINRGRDEAEEGIDSMYVRFMRDVKEARYNYEASLCGDIEIQGRDGAWQAMCWLLERRNPKSFGRNALELNKIEELESQLDELKAIIANKFHGGPHNGCSKDEHGGKPQD